MKYFLISVAVCSLFLFIPNAFAENPVPTSGGVSSSVVVARAVTDHFKGLVATKTALTEAQRIESLVKSVRAIEDRGLWGSRSECKSKFQCDKYKDLPKVGKFKRCTRKLNRCFKKNLRVQSKRLRIAKAAFAAEKATGVDAVFLIAVGRMESDFRPLYLVNSGCKNNHRTCWADCGITQAPRSRSWELCETVL